MNSKLYLVERALQNRRKNGWRERSYSNGERVLADGIYSVEHGSHRLPAEVTLESGSDFPGCAACQEAVTFRFLRKVEISEKFHVKLYVLPVMPEEAEGAPEKAA